MRSLYMAHVSKVLTHEQAFYCAKQKPSASAKIVKIEFSANMDLLGFSHFITFKEC